MPTVDYYFSVMSPYVYIGSVRVAQLAARGDWRYRPLHFSSMAARMKSLVMTDADPARAAYFAQDLPRQAARAGLPILAKPPYWPGNSAPASYAIIAAQNAPQGGDLHGLVAGFSAALWAEGRDIADDQVVADILSAHGFDPKIADRGMFAAAETYAQNLEDAVVAGVFGTPFFVVGDQRFWGQDRISDLENHLATHLARL